jgi:gluconate 5-dehydrogenase
MQRMKLFDLSGRTALITGSSKGIGLALARLEHARAALAAEGFSVHAAAFDVTDAAAVEAGIAQVEADIGAIDILVNNAGMQHRAPFEQFPPAAFSTLMRTNLDSVFLVGRAVAQRMIPRGRGKIINVCSVQSELGRPGIAPYAASKGAVKMLTKGMAIDLGRHGIQVNGLGPGYFKTELTQALVADATFSAWLAGRTPAGRWGEVEELGGAAIFLASDASSFVSGHVLYVDGGITASL